VRRSFSIPDHISCFSFINWGSFFIICLWSPNERKKEIIDQESVRHPSFLLFYDRVHYDLNRSRSNKRKKDWRTMDSMMKKKEIDDRSIPWPNKRRNERVRRTIIFLFLFHHDESIGHGWRERKQAFQALIHRSSLSLMPCPLLSRENISCKISSIEEKKFYLQEMIFSLKEELDFPDENPIFLANSWWASSSSISCFFGQECSRRSVALRRSIIPTMKTGTQLQLHQGYLPSLINGGEPPLREGTRGSPDLIAVWMNIPF